MDGVGRAYLGDARKAWAERMKNVIVGAGPAGVVAAETIRAHDAACDIVLLNGESELPYARMTLPYFLAGAIDASETRLRRKEDHFEQQRIELVNGRVRSVDLTNRSLELEGGTSLSFDQLLVATGSRPKFPPAEGLDQPGVCACWTLQDAREVARRASRGAKVVQIGAGFVASIIMKALVARGVELTVVAGSSGRIMRSMLCSTASEMIRARCEARGIRFVTGERVKAIEPGPAVRMADGSVLDADLVVIATGVDANTSFLPSEDIELDEGVLVDDRLQSSVSGVFAAGDVAQSRVFGKMVREVQPTQPAAVEHGRLAGLNMGGIPTTSNGSLRMNVAATMGLYCCSFGRWDAREEGIETAEVRDASREQFLRLAFEGDRVVGANLVGFENHAGALRGLIQTGVRLGPWRSRLQRDPSRFVEAFVARMQGS